MTTHITANPVKSDQRTMTINHGHVNGVAVRV